MIHWQTVKEFFGCGGDTAQPLTEGKTKSPEVGTVPNKPTAPPPAPLRVVKPRQSQISLKKAKARKAGTNPKHYYRRGGSYYNVSDGSLIEDLLLLYVLTELFSADEIGDYDSSVTETITAEPVEDLLDIDVSSTPVVEAETFREPAPAYTPPEPTYSEPEPVRESSSYSSGSSDSSSYDSGSSDSGGGCD